MARKFPEHPARPERICWGCDRYCPAEALACGNGSERTQHPVELFGEDWLAWSPAGVPPAGDATPGPDQAPARSPGTRE
ncbi:DUF3079 domain-containing protein [Paracidovorax avenae]|uniref:DUF3079 domain-containing protein n=1 Tax=Paracidovorax avenae TaxID=80867 RepID=UPI000D159C27|nr:DUF3079 domain-containing protein [Paracidovorax avenae]AVS94170.1 DUF3079 domain-containing protein [Paracidovorax avenae]AVT06713.1 DUF3079 domain-containing protein [Paracidovorax avenae]AVT21079.1 DUF3079 domain-containing protein [Paracidovorax avenae]